ncbi:MAG TPA: hypothetical protein VG738_00990 [Chitinophagaceae bacterium]|nr:hypothetical protein [Chitinophagaceae bacterium]
MMEAWIFHGTGSVFSSGVFITKEAAETYIKKYKLTGVLTLYPVNEGIYDWAIANKIFTPKKESERTSEFIQRFTTASQEHYHYEDGERG